MSFEGVTYVSPELERLVALVRADERAATVTKDEALKLALEALEGIHPGNMTPMAEEYWNKAITGIKQALAAQPAVQEPVAWVLTEELTRRKTTTGAHLWFSDPVNCMWTPIYTTPPAAAVPDALNPKDEHPAYATGWNDCRAEMLKGMKP